MKRYLLALLLTGTIISAHAMDRDDRSAAPSMQRKGLVQQSAQNIADQITALKEQFVEYSRELARMMNEQPAAVALEPAAPAPVWFDQERRQQLRGELIGLIRTVRTVDQLCAKRDSQAFKDELLKSAQQAIEAQTQAGLDFAIRAMDYYKQLAGVSLPDDYIPLNKAELKQKLEALRVGFYPDDLCSNESNMEYLTTNHPMQALELLNYLDRAHQANADQNPHDALKQTSEYQALLQEIQTVFERDVAPAASRMEEIFFPQRVAERRALEERARAEAPARREPVTVAEDDSRNSARRASKTEDEKSGGGLFD